LRDAPNEHSGDFPRPLFVFGHGLHATGGRTSSDALPSTSDSCQRRAILDAWTLGAISAA
jgi:hypothetical protein